MDAVRRNNYFFGFESFSFYGFSFYWRGEIRLSTPRTEGAEG